MDHDLGDTIVVTEVDEQDAAVVADAEDPAGKFGGGARIRGSELATGVCAIRVHNRYPRKKRASLYQKKRSAVTLGFCARGNRS
jgi:hypothetical protein